MGYLNLLLRPRKILARTSIHANHTARLQKQWYINDCAGFQRGGFPASTGRVTPQPGVGIHDAQFGVGQASDLSLDIGNSSRNLVGADIDTLAGASIDDKDNDIVSIRYVRDLEETSKLPLFSQEDNRWSNKKHKNSMMTNDDQGPISTVREWTPTFAQRRGSFMRR